VDPDRAHELLAAERKRIEDLLRRLGGDQSDDPSTADSADLGSDTLTAELDEGRRDDLLVELGAVARAEQRLANGTYGLSIESGEPIPDERLEIKPAAERTAAEQARFEGRTPLR
jgi:DnaK suppressor protein